jgi:hypothetical protein
LPNNPSNEADLILDDCIQKLLFMKDNNTLDILDMKLAVSQMMDELKENRKKKMNPLMELISSDDESFTEII